MIFERDRDQIHLFYRLSSPTFIIFSQPEADGNIAIGVKQETLRACAVTDVKRGGGDDGWLQTKLLLKIVCEAVRKLNVFGLCVSKHDEC